MGADVRAVRMPTAQDLAEAASVVRDHLPPTPLVPLNGFWLKLECLQPTGSFKVRGALAALAAFAGQPAVRRAGGVVTASAGNHALGVAFAATRLGVEATVVVPVTASPAKVSALRGFAIDLVQHGSGYSDAERHALDLARSGATYISPYNDPYVIAGQASVGPELPDGPLTIVAPVGGGGLVAGLCLWAAGRPGVRVIGVEARASRAVSAAVSAGHLVEVDVGPTLADGLAGNLEPGSITPAIIGEHAAGLVSVSEPEIRHAIRYLAAEQGLVVEGAGAVAVAALLARRVDAAGAVVALVTGRNIALATLCDLLT